MQEYIKKILGSGKQNNITALIISNDEKKDIIEIAIKNKEEDFLVCY